MALIEVKNLSKIYKNNGTKTKALQGVSFNIDEGEFVSIVGPSGSGKSTLMHILGFLDRPTSGEYFFEGKNVKNFSDDELAYIRNRKVGFVFQFYNLLARTTVLENVLLPTTYTKEYDPKKMRERALKILDRVGLSHRVDYLPNQLSGGEQQRVAIVRALMNNPKIIFADEPTGNLDSASGKEIMEILQSLNEEGNTIILVTHELYTSRHAKRIIKLKDGRVISDEILRDGIRKIAKLEKALTK